MSKSVVVLAPPRSGSSMLGGILSKLGVAMGDKNNLEKSRFYNSFGCYEDQDFVRLEFKMSIKIGYYFNLINIPSIKKVNSLRKDFEDEIKGLIEKKNKRELWGWKHPLTVFFIPLYAPYLENPHYIILKRDLNSITDSMYNRFDDRKNFFKKLRIIMEYKELWNPKFLLSRISEIIFNKSLFNDYDKVKENAKKFYDKSFKFVEKRKHLVIEYKELIENPKKNIGEIIKFLDINPSEERINNSINFVRPEEKHF